ncbi:MAG: 16S rRNA (adenine(1518)-N(6)/adenine(1519)-N(6))-dimethyltransferase RsmA, partial [Opitutales bacterium]
MPACTRFLRRPPGLMPLSKTQTRELLNRLEHFPKKKMGQNFLIDGNIVRKTLRLAELNPGEPVVEIGAGLGTLTHAILESGAPLHTMERDPALAQYLRETFAEYPNFNLLEGDCLQHPLAGLPQPEGQAFFSILANLPYAVATPWMEAALAGALPRRMVLMLQKEAADRYAAAPKTKQFGAISIFLQAAYRIRTAHPVSAGCFHPAPKIGSVLLQLDRRSDAVRFAPEVRACIRRIFTRRRKQ